MPTASRSRLQGPRGLAKHVPPARRRAHTPCWTIPSGDRPSSASARCQLRGHNHRRGSVPWLQRHFSSPFPDIGRQAPTVFQSSARDPAGRIPLNIVAAATASAKSPASQFFAFSRDPVIEIQDVQRIRDRPSLDGCHQSIAAEIAGLRDVREYC